MRVPELVFDALLSSGKLERTGRQLRREILEMEGTLNQNPEIEFRNVSLSFDDRPALNDVSFKLERGEMLFLTGVSGSGKSSLLHLAIGLTKPDEGQIFVKGQEID